MKTPTFITEIANRIIRTTKEFCDLMNIQLSGV